MKTKEELNALKTEAEALNKKLEELTEDELAQVAGGDLINMDPSEIERFDVLKDASSSAIYGSRGAE